MAIENEAPAVEVTTDPVVTDPATPVDPATPGETTTEDDPASKLPDWAQKEREKLRRESASYRTQLREAQEALAKAKTPEEFENVQVALAKANQQLIIRDNTEGLPKEIIEASWVQWPSDEEGIKKVAESLRAFVATKTEQEAPPITGGELLGGLNPSSNTQLDTLDPAVLASRVRSHRNRR